MRVFPCGAETDADGEDRHFLTCFYLTVDMRHFSVLNQTEMQTAQAETGILTSDYRGEE